MLEKHRFSDAFRGYRNVTLNQNGLISIDIPLLINQSISFIELRNIH